MQVIKSLLWMHPDMEKDKNRLYTFIKWINFYIQKKQIHIEKIYDLVDNENLKILVELLWDEKINNFDSTSNTKNTKINNIQKIIQFLKLKNVDTSDVFLQQIIRKKNLKLFLNFIWIIISKYLEDSIYFYGLKGQKALLKWCNKFVENDFDNLFNSWDNGKTMCLILNNFYPNEININFNEYYDDDLNFLPFFFVCLQKIGAPIIINPNNIKYLDEQSIILQYAIIFDYISSTTELNSNFNDNLNQNESSYKASFQCSNVNQPNFNNGMISMDDLSRFIKSENSVIKKINQHFKIKMYSRYPVKVAYIEENGEDLKVIYLIKNLENVINRAERRPIIFVSLLGRYQQGKTTIISGITGNIGYVIGSGSKETTNGVYIDGPYDIDYLYQRFHIDMREDIYYGGNELLSPLIYFFDMEGYDGVMHGENIEKNNKAYIEMCTPFLCLSSIFILLSEPNPNASEINNFFERVKVSNLTTYSNNDDSNGALQLSIVFNKNNDICNDFKDKTKKEIIKTIKQFQDKQKNEWNGDYLLKKHGIKYEFFPILQGLQPYYEDGSFYKVFQYFVKKIVRSIEMAAEGKFVRSGERSLRLFEYIINKINEPSFERNIKLLIRCEHEESFKTFSINALNETKFKLYPQIEDEFNQYVNDLQFDIDIVSIKNKYIDRGKKEMQKELKVVQDHPSVAGSIDMMISLIRKKVDENYDYLINYKNDLFDEFINKIDKKAEEKTSKILDLIFENLNENQNFNYDQVRIQECINHTVTLFRDDLTLFKDENNIFELPAQKIDEIVKEKQLYIESIIQNHITNEKNVKELQEEIEMSSKLVRLQKILISKKYNEFELNQLKELKINLNNKEFFKSNYNHLNKVCLQIQQSINDLICFEKEDLIDTIHSKQTGLVSKINYAFDDAKIGLSKITHETRNIKISLLNERVETRTIREYPTSEIEYEEWKSIRIQRRQFSDIKDDILE